MPTFEIPKAPTHVASRRPGDDSSDDEAEREYGAHTNQPVAARQQTQQRQSFISPYGGSSGSAHGRLSRPRANSDSSSLDNRRADGGFFPPDPPGATDPPPWGQGFAPFSNLILGQNALETRTSSVYVKLEKPYTRSSGWGATFAYTWTDSEQNSPIDGWPMPPESRTASQSARL